MKSKEELIKIMAEAMKKLHWEEYGFQSSHEKESAQAALEALCRTLPEIGQKEILDRPIEGPQDLEVFMLLYGYNQLLEYGKEDG